MIHFDNGSSQFIVKYIYLMDSEGARAVPITFCNGSSKLIVASNPVDQSFGGKSINQIGNKQAAPIAFSYDPFRLIVESILISNDLINQIFKGTRGPIIFVVTSKKDKIQVLLKIFCEGESDNESSLTSTVATMLDRNVDARTAKMRNGGVNCSNGLVGQTGLVGDIGLIKLISLVGHICISGLVGFIGFGLISLVSGFGLIGLSGISCLAGQISLIGFIGLIGVISFSLIALLASAVLLAHRPCNFAAATCQVGPVGCTSSNSFNGVSGLISQVGLNSLICLGLVGFIGFGLCWKRTQLQPSCSPNLPL